jgi:hypothetical protein
MLEASGLEQFNKDQAYKQQAQEEKNAEFNRRFRLQNKERDGLTLSYGFRTFEQMKTSYDLIQSTPVGEYYEGQSGRRFLKQKDGNYLAPDNSIFTPNQLKRYEQFNHLPDFPEEEKDIVQDNETETTETAPPTIAQQMLDTKRGEGVYDKFTKSQLRKALKNGEVSEDILKKYLLQIPGVSIDEKGMVKGLKDVTATPFNNAMKTLQKEEGINLGY